MSTTFHHLNQGWNAEPNAPEPKPEWDGNALRLTFLLNAFQFSEFDEGDLGDLGEITFVNCTRYRIGSLNDEGFYRGQGRFGGIAHEWGEFYELEGDLRLSDLDGTWNIRTDETTGPKHYLFYFRDTDFECSAEAWRFRTIKEDLT